MAETLLIVFIVFIVLGMPISIALAVGALGASIFYPVLNPIIIPTRLVGLLSDSYLLLSAPLFILAGNIAARGGVAHVLIDLATVMVGRFRGGLAYVNVLDSMFFGGISGSAVADVSALGTVLIPQMVRKGYDLDFAAALSISAAVVAPIIPPSIIAVIYAWMAEESVAAMFAAGIIPGLLVGCGMFVPIFVIARKRNYPKEPPPTRVQFLSALVRAVPALMIPVVIMGGILFGIFTPTEAAAVAVVYALVVPPIFYGEPSLKELPKIFADSARLSGVIGLIIGFVGAFGWVLTFSKFPFAVATAIAAIAPSWWMFIVLVILLYLLLGTFLTPSEIILVTVPVLLPVAQSIGVHPIHFGMVCVIASAVGHITPPVGLCLFVGMAISGLPMDKLIRPLLPFLAAIVVALLLVAFVPELTLVVPRVLGFVRQ
jgi:tripartite ATP-independent transporter DctM subunit